MQLGIWLSTGVPRLVNGIASIMVPRLVNGVVERILRNIATD